MKKNPLLCDLSYDINNMIIQAFFGLSNLLTNLRGLMKKRLLFIFGILFLTISGYVNASQYVGVHLGTDYGHLTNGSNNGQKVGLKTGLTFGHNFGQGFRAEAELCYRNNPYKPKDLIIMEENAAVRLTRNVSSLSYLGNIIYDVSQIGFKTFTPYFGIGLGYSQHKDKFKTKMKNSSSTATLRDNGFVYQGIVGAKYPFSETVDVAVAYHYFIGRSHIKNHSFSLSLAQNF